MVLGKIMASPTSPSKLPWFPRKTGDRQTDRHMYAHTDLLYTVTLTAHDCRRWLVISLILYHYGRLFLMNFQGSCTIIMKSTEVQTLGELRMRHTAKLMGLSCISVCVSPASGSRRVWHGLATVVDSVRETIHALLCLQNTERRTWSRS